MIPNVWKKCSKPPTSIGLKPSLTQHWNPYTPMRLTVNLQEMGCIDHPPTEGVLFWTGVRWWFKSIWTKKNWDHHPSKGFKTKRQDETTKHDYLYINIICAKVKHGPWHVDAYGCIWFIVIRVIKTNMIIGLLNSL